MGEDGARGKDWLRVRGHHLCLTDTIFYLYIYIYIFFLLILEKFHTKPTVGGRSNKIKIK